MFKAPHFQWLCPHRLHTPQKESVPAFTNFSTSYLTPAALHPAVKNLFAFFLPLMANMTEDAFFPSHWFFCTFFGPPIQLIARGTSTSSLLACISVLNFSIPPLVFCPRYLSTLTTCILALSQSPFILMSTLTASSFLAAAITLSLKWINFAACTPGVVIVNRHPLVFLVTPWMHTEYGTSASKCALFTFDNISKSFFWECLGSLLLLEITLLDSIEICPAGISFRCSFVCCFFLSTSFQPLSFFCSWPCCCCWCWGCFCGGCAAALSIHVSFFFSWPSCFPDPLFSGFFTSSCLFFPSFGPLGIATWGFSPFFSIAGTVGASLLAIVTCTPTGIFGNSFLLPPEAISGACLDWSSSCLSTSIFSISCSSSLTYLWSPWEPLIQTHLHLSHLVFLQGGFNLSPPSDFLSLLSFFT